MKSGTQPLPPLRAVKILDQVRERIRYLHYSLRTEEAYVYRVRFLYASLECVTQPEWSRMEE